MSLPILRMRTINGPMFWPRQQQKIQQCNLYSRSFTTMSNEPYRQEFLSAWQDRWDDFDKGLHTYNLISKVSKELHFFPHPLQHSSLVRDPLNNNLRNSIIPHYDSVNVWNSEPQSTPTVTVPWLKSSNWDITLFLLNPFYKGYYLGQRGCRN